MIKIPYIKKDDRLLIEGVLTALNGHIDTVGKLNFTITLLVHKYIMEHKLCYDQLNAVIGVLECAKLELYRQVAAKYENKKKMENGAISKLDSKTLEDVR